MQGEFQGTSAGRDALGRYKPGYNSRKAMQLRIMVKTEQLRHEYFPCGGESGVDASRLMLAAKHYVTAETARDPVVSQRATRCAELLLSKLKRPEQPVPSITELGL